jgi:ATP-binding cassette subfamily F protein uup
MSLLLNCQGLSKSFGVQTLFSGIDLNVHKGDRIGLIGPNGSGKSTLLRILAMLDEPDLGRVFLQKHCRVAYLAQEDRFDDSQTPVQALIDALPEPQVDAAEALARAHALLSRAEFTDPDISIAALSGGWRKRLAICRALIVHPDILLMDEPTNHLDIEGILWLEKLLTARMPESPDAFILVSHDRRFLENTVNRIIELAALYPGGTLESRGAYSDFLEKRTLFLASQQEQETRLANKMRRETEWLRRGPKARTSKAKYRIDAAGKLARELAETRARNRSAGALNIDFAATGRKTKKLLEAKKISKGFGDRRLFRDLDLVLTPQQRLGLLGRNGCGKSTLMQILAHAPDPDGEYGPDSGTLTTADTIRIVYFDQRRQELDQNQTLKQALAPDGDSILYQDRTIHVASWAKRFLFRPDQLETPVGRLSGGEQARILIARLMRQEADILLLDEPTNDLDIPSLDVLEESLLEFSGALVLVTHDRYLLERVCDQVLGFDGQGNTTFFADYNQWLDWLRSREKPAESSLNRSGKEKTKKRLNRKKLSYLEQREYDAMEETIQPLEERGGELEILLADPGIANDPEQVETLWKEQQALNRQIEQLYDRWQELEEKISGSA